MEKLSILIIGIGEWGEKWIETIRSFPEFTIVGLVDKNFEKINQIVEKFNIDKTAGFNNLKEALDKTESDIALIVVPPESHFPIVFECMKKGINILSEKPLANNMEEAVRLLQEANQRNIQFVVSQDYRWQSPIKTLHSLLKNGVIGEIGYITYQHFQSLQIGGWRESMKNVILEDMAIHHFDILRYITGKECIEVYAESYNPKWSWYEGGATTSILLTFEEDIRVNYFGTWVSTGKPNSWPGEIRIEGDKGTLLLTSKGEIFQYSNKTEEMVDQEEMKYTGREYALQQMKKALLEGSETETGIEDNIMSFAITRAALLSNELHRPVILTELMNWDN